MSARIKGQAFLGFLDTLERVRGVETRRQVTAGLPEDVRAALRNGEIVAMGWYSIEWYGSVHAAARAVCGPSVSREIGREAARSDFNTIYRFILKFLSPATLLKKSSNIFALFCDEGKVTAATKPGSARIHYSDCSGACRGMWETVLGSTELMIELCGGRGVSGKAVSGGGDGDSSMVAQFTWTES